MLTMREQITYLTAIMALQQALLEKQKEVIEVYRRQAEASGDVHRLVALLEKFGATNIAT